MAVSTGFTAIIMPLSFNGLPGVNNAKARVTGTFHLGNGRHGSLLKR